MALVVTVFIAIFAAVVLVAFGLQGSPEARRKLTNTRLAAIPVDPNFQEVGDDLEGIIRDESMSQMPWLNRILQRVDVLGKLQTILLQADSKWTVARLLAYSILAFLCAFLAVLWRTGHVMPAIVAGNIAGALPVLQVLTQRSARIRRFEQKLPDALDMMVSAIRAGHSLNMAIGTVARETAPPISAEFRKCYDEQNFGMDLRTSMIHLTERMPLHDVQIVVTAILIQRDSGGNLAEILEKAAHVIRERFRLKRQIQVHTAQGRMTGWVLALLPPLLGFGIYLVNPDYMAKLWQNPLGVKLLYTSGAMTTMGALIIRKIINVRI